MIPRQVICDVMDDCRLSDEDRRRALIASQRIHRFSGVARVVYRYIDRHAAIHSGPLRILVVPCPDIEIPLSWARRSRKSGTLIEYVLVNVDPHDAVRSKIDLAIAQGDAIECIDLDCSRGSIPAGFDLIVSMYCMHRLREDQIFRQLQSMITSTGGPLLVCDYARSTTNVWLAKIASGVLSRNPTVRQSAANHILTAYSIDEFQRVAEEALARPVKVEPLFPCHFIMACEEKAIPEAVPAFA
jgi:hypothetical protein